VPKFGAERLADLTCLPIFGGGYPRGPRPPPRPPEERPCPFERPPVDRFGDARFADDRLEVALLADERVPDDFFADEDVDPDFRLEDVVPLRLAVAERVAPERLKSTAWWTSASQKIASHLNASRPAKGRRGSPTGHPTASGSPSRANTSRTEDPSPWGFDATSISCGPTAPTSDDSRSSPARTVLRHGLRTASASCSPATGVRQAIYVMNADGSQQMRLTTGTDDVSPVWGPRP
jgi:hypothetical protein